MDKPLIGYRSHVFHIIPPEKPSFRRFPSFPRGFKLLSEIIMIKSYRNVRIMLDLS